MSFIRYGIFEKGSCCTCWNEGSLLASLSTSLSNVKIACVRVWNTLRANDSDDPQTTFNAEMKFAEKSIARNPKSYWVWGHRIWLLSDAVASVNNPVDDTTKTVAKPIAVDWAHELKLCAQLLEMDDRNCKRCTAW
jgi:hypothetical protein